MDNIPKLGVYTKKGYETTVTTGFKKAVKQIKPVSEGQYISVEEWWKQINELADDQGWSLAMRVRFLLRTGGLAKGVNDTYRDRVTNILENYHSWLDYDNKAPEEDNNYWLYIWVDVGLKFISEFYTVQDSAAIEEGLMKLFTKEKYRFTDKNDPLNKDFYKVVILYQDALAFLKERSSDLVNSPLYVFKLLKDWVKKQGVPGKLMEDYITKAVAKLPTDPESVFPLNHGMTVPEMREVRRKGITGVSEKSYRLILEQLKKRALKLDLTYNLTSYSQMAEMQGNIDGEEKGEWKTKEKKQKKHVNSVSTDYSMAMNTVSGGTTAEAPVRYPACPTCAMFHPKGEKESCPFWDKNKRVFKVKAFLEFRNVAQVQKDGTTLVGEFWLAKLRKFAFPHMGINKEEDKQKIIRDLKETARSLPTVPMDQIAERMKRNRTTNLALQEEATGSGVLSELQTQVVNLAKQLSQLEKGEGKSSKPKAKKAAKSKAAKAKKAKKREKEREEQDSDESDSDPAPGLRSDSSDSESDASSGSD